MREPSSVPHFVHITPGFGMGGAQVRTTQIINHLGARFRHTLVSLDGEFQAAGRIHSPVLVSRVTCPPTANPLAMAMRLRRVLESLQPDLVLTYNFGSLDAMSALAVSNRRVPVVHTEDGFGPDEAVQQKARRVWFRRVLLRRASRVIAPSLVLRDIMRNVWRVPSARIAYIPNGVDTDLLRPCESSSPLSAGRPFVLGTVGGLRREKQQDVLLAVAARLAETSSVRVLIAGDGPERQRLQDYARSLGISHLVEFLGHQEDLASVYRRLDLFVLTSSTEQMPLSVLEAMASGLPVVSTDVGDVSRMVSSENRALIVADQHELVPAICGLFAHPARLARIGGANRQHCLATYGLSRMLTRYEEMYRTLLMDSQSTPSGKDSAYAGNQDDLYRRRSA